MEHTYCAQLTSSTSNHNLILFVDIADANKGERRSNFNSDTQLDGILINVSGTIIGHLNFVIECLLDYGTKHHLHQQSK